MTNYVGPEHTENGAIVGWWIRECFVINGEPQPPIWVRYKAFEWPEYY